MIRGLRKLSLPLIMGYDRGGYLRPFFIVLTIAIPTGLDNQTLENVDATDSDKRAELGVCFLA